jgi:hypothetical protein
MAVSLTPNGKWLTGDTPDGGTSAVYATTIIAVREETIGFPTGNSFGTWVTTSSGVATLYAGKQATAIYNIIKDMTIVV